jgi:type I restriction enzyme S subunit
MKPYPAYKDSGIEWLGEIPEHWDISRLKYVAMVQPSNVDKKSLENEEMVLLCNYVDVYNNDYITKVMSFMKATATSNEINKFSLRKRDVLVTKDSETPEDIAKAALIKDELNNVLCGYHLTQIRPNRQILLGDYLFRLFHNKKFKDQFVVNANGVTRFGLSSYYFSNSFITILKIREQQKITDYLDRKI